MKGLTIETLPFAELAMSENLDIDNVAEVLHAALGKGNETPTIEFKEYIDLDNEETRNWLIRAIAAMANGETNGFIFIGIKDSTHEIKGLEESLLKKFDTTQVHQKISAFLAPTPHLDVHRFTFEGKRIVGIVIQPFSEFPCFVSQSFSGYSAGTILIRTPGGESAPAAKESDIRRLCERITSKHADFIASYFLRYTRLSKISEIEVQPDHGQISLDGVRALASHFWKPGKSYLEVFFSPCSIIAKDKSAFREVFPASHVMTKFHGFPTTHLSDWPGPRLRPQGWIATVPDKPNGDPSSPPIPHYLWAMHESWAFLDRNPYWEDDPDSLIIGGIGIMHLATRICLLLRLLRRVGQRYQLNLDQRFLIGTRLKGVKGRYFASEYTTMQNSLPQSEEDDVEVSRRINLSSLENFSEKELAVPPVVFDMMEEAGWRLGRTDLTIDVYRSAIRHAAQRVEPAIIFPRKEDVSLYGFGQQ